MALTYAFTYNELNLHRQGNVAGNPGAEGVVTADNSYPQAAGGYDVEVEEFHPTDCASVDMMVFNVNNTHYAVFDEPTKKVKVFLQATDAEVGDGVSLAGVKWNFTARMTGQ